MGATVAARTKGKVAQYQLEGTTASTTIGPYDSGNILGTVPPGGSGIKLIDGTVQEATDITSDGKTNAFGPTQDSQGFLKQSTYQAASQGLSLAPEHE